MTSIIPLTKGYECLIDDEDLEWLSQRKWHSVIGNGGVYAASRINYKIVFMHNLILGISVTKKICGDHIDGNTLNNERYNLQIISRSNNTRKAKKRYNATSIYTGVSFDYSRDRWIAQIKIDGTNNFLGRFKEESCAHDAYLKAIREMENI